MVKSGFRYYALILVLAAACTQTATMPYVIDVDLPTPDPPYSPIKWAEGCVKAEGRSRPVVVSVHPRAGDRIGVFAYSGDASFMMRPLVNDGPPLPADPTQVYQSRVFPGFEEARRAIPAMTEAVRPKALEVTQTCIFLDMDQTLPFWALIDLHQTLTEAGLPGANLVAKEAME